MILNEYFCVFTFTLNRNSRWIPPGFPPPGEFLLAGEASWLHKPGGLWNKRMISCRLFREVLGSSGSKLPTQSFVFYLAAEELLTILDIIINCWPNLTKKIKYTIFRACHGDFYSIYGGFVKNVKTIV